MALPSPSATSDRRAASRRRTDARLAPSSRAAASCPVPWCESCDRFYNPKALAPDGTCMNCGAFIADPGEEKPESGGEKAPWHFWLLVAAVVIYLTLRFIQIFFRIVT